MATFEDAAVVSWPQGKREPKTQEDKENALKQAFAHA
jgi:hypothetical protein